MKRLWKNIYLFFILTLILAIGAGTTASINIQGQKPFNENFLPIADTVKIDTTGQLPFPFKDQSEFVLPNKNDSSDLFLKKPSNIKTEIEFDPATGEYIIYEKIGDLNYRLPKSLSVNDYLKFDVKRSISDYWRQKRRIQDLDERGGLVPTLTIGGEAFNRLFGGNTIDIKPQGYVEVVFGYQMNATENPSLPENLRRTPTFDFDNKIQMNVVGKIGEKMQMRVNYNTEATFDYENKMNIEYSGTEDEILKKIEAGNVSLPLNGSLITGGSNLFGIKAEMQFGKLNLTTIFSQNKGETKVVETEGGAQRTTFDINVADYDANRHFFIAQYFRDYYDQALKTLPIIKSAITINKIEVWVTNKTSNFQEARNIIAFTDLGEHEPNIYNNVPGFAENSGLQYPENIYPFNDANKMYEAVTSTFNDIRDIEKINRALAPLSSYKFSGGNDFEKIEQARKLSASEFSINENLGYISLNSSLNTDEVLAVAFNYTANGKTYQVGEFSSDGVDAPQTLVLKLLKGTNLSPKLPTWDLMMKNIYNLNAYELTKEDFVLDVVYLNDKTGTYVNYLPGSNIEGRVLLGVMNLDQLNSQLDPGQDGVFDYVQGITVNPKSARIIFPVIEPFGSHLRDSIGNDLLAEKFVFQALYDSTQTKAEQDAEHNKFRIQGSFKGSSSSEIALGAINVARGSVKVSAGGRQLVENIDYTVDYTLGRVKIINAGLLESGTPIQISTESQDLFSMQRKTMMGAYANYEFSNNFNMGATILHMQEQPLTRKVDYGEDPISNTMIGLDARYNTTSQLLTTLIDKIPFINTKETSTLSIEAEYAQLFPGHSKAISSNGAAYIDDFEATKTTLNMSSRHAWVLASAPQLQNKLFPEGDLNDNLAYGFNRAKIAWYTIDPLFLRNTTNTPAHIKNDKDQQSNHFVREVYQKEIFPDRELPTGIPTNIPVFDLAFYPSEKGPYNFDVKPNQYSAGINIDGTLRDPQSRWGGIMRKIETTDFETANIEFIEFWMMDPFVYDQENKLEGGDLYFNLGEISEDILKDSKKSFENGLPTAEIAQKVDTTIWGRVSTQQSLVNAFDNNPQSRQYQDVGLDGLGDENEKTFYQDYLNSLQTIVDQQTYTRLGVDPSSDNFHYYRGTKFDEDEVSILERYKNFNGPDGNSPTSEMSDESYPTNASSIPDIEDINNDNTLNEYERYYQYKVSVRKKDMVIGKNYISDIKHSSVTLKNGQIGEVDWYQFKIPVRSPDQIFGSISDFKSIRFMRMIMQGFKDPTILRFATLDLIRADWRKYSRSLDNEIDLGTAETTFDVSAVNVEENSSKEPVNYILPPGIERDNDPANTQILQLNEQSLMLKANDLEQGSSRAAYKNIYLDFRTYKRLRMEVHAEEIEGNPLKDDELYLFVRLGSDFNYNYYEYEVPLKLTRKGKYSSTIEADRYAVWPDENRLNVALELFTTVKEERNAAMRQAGSNMKVTEVYEMADDQWMDGRNRVRVKGNPNLGNVEVMMLGVRNKKGTINTGPKSVEVWLNELRLTDFDESGGWAANLRVSTRLADLGSITLAGRTRSAGFGSIDKKVNERAMDDLTEYDISSNFELGKFFPEKSGVRIPLYMGYSKRVSNPKYNPLDPDILMENALANAGNKSEKDSIKQIAQDFSTRKSINLTNVKVDRMFGKEPRLYDPANFALSYSYNEIFNRNVNTEFNINKDHRGLFTYSYNNNPEPIEPFKKVKFLRGNALRFIRDFNFYLLPSQISYRIDLGRQYNEVQLRNVTNPNMIIQPTYNKNFLLNNYLDLTYNLTRTLKVDFSSQKTARIDEPAGRINRRDDDYEWKRDSIMTNLYNMGRPTLYHHTFRVSYIIPINKIPLFDWLSSSVNYQGEYNWYAGALTDPSIRLGNNIDNARVAQFNGQVTVTSLYDKVGFLKRINEKYGKGTASSRSLRSRSQAKKTQTQNPMPENETGSKFKTVKYNGNNIAIKANVPRSINHNLNTEKVQVNFFDSENKPIEGDVKILSENRITFTTDKNYNNTKVTVSGQVEQGGNPFIQIAERTTRILMGVRSFNFTYSSTDGSVLPGFMPEPKFFGSGQYTPDPNFSNGFTSTVAPGLPFLLGWQDKNFAQKAAENGWLTNDSTLNMPYQMNHTENFSVRANIEPVGDLRIDMEASRIYSENTSEFYLFDSNTDRFNSVNKTLRGNFTMSVNTLGTAFSKMGEEGVQASDAFQALKDNRIIIAKRIAASRISNIPEQYDPQLVVEKTGYPVGYSATSQQVLIPAFIAAYTKQDPSKVSLEAFPSILYLRPNWRINYDGMVTQIEGLKDIFKTLSFSHSYHSTYNIGSFTTNLKYDDSEYNDGFSYVRNTIGGDLGAKGDFVGKYDINSVSINEQFNPLFNIDMTFMNDLTMRAEIRRSRNLSLSFSNNQLTEILSNELSLGFGYRFTKMDLIIKTKRSQKSYSNDLNIRADLAFRKNKTILRKLVEEDDQLTAGQNAITIKTTADYMLSDRFELRLYFDKVINKPFTSLSFPTSNTNFGVSFRFTLAE